MASFRTTWVSRYQKIKQFCISVRQEMVGFGDCSGVSWNICKQYALQHLITQLMDALPDAQPAVSKLCGQALGKPIPEGKTVIDDNEASDNGVLR